MSSHIGAMLLVWFVINSFLLAFVWIDSRKKNLDSGFWTIVIFLLGVFGFAIYAIKRPTGDSTSTPNSEPDDSINSAKLSNLTHLDGVGQQSAESLYKEGYESIRDIRQSESSEITQATGIGSNEIDEIKKQISTSDLRQIPGIGAMKAESLYGSGFESIEDLREANAEDLAQIEAIGPNLAKRIKREVRFDD